MVSSAGRRVVMLLENNPYPQDPRVRREATALVAAGYQVSVICPCAPDQTKRQVLDGVHVYRYLAPPSAIGFFSYLVEYAYSLIAAFILSLVVLKARGFDVVHAHNPPDLFVFIAAFYKLFGKRFVYDHHDLSPELFCARFTGTGGRLAYRLLILFERLSCRLADCVIASNQSYKAIEVKRGGVPEARITIVRNGPGLDLLQPVEPKPGLRQDGRIVIGYVGVMGFQDGIDYLLRALKYLANELGRTDFLCVLVGSGDALVSLESLAEQLELDDHVVFTGWVEPDEVPSYLSAADICVTPDPSNPYNDRSTMIKMMEYMALGKPIVAFDLPEHRVSSQEAALYAHPNDELDLARKIAVLMDEPERRERMGILGRQRVGAELAWEFQAKKLLEVYSALSVSL